MLAYADNVRQCLCILAAAHPRSQLSIPLSRIFSALRVAPKRISLLDAPAPGSAAMAPTMTAHPLAPLLAPSSVAIFGASNDPTRISGRSLRYYREAGYKGGLYPINPTRDQAQGLTAFPDIAAIPGPVECAVIAVPANLAIEPSEASV